MVGVEHDPSVQAKRGARIGHQSDLVTPSGKRDVAGRDASAQQDIIHVFFRSERLGDRLTPNTHGQGHNRSEEETTLQYLPVCR